MGYKYVFTGGKEVRQLESLIPITGEFDVIVAGGGTAGVVAAVSAARLGAKTLLLERNGYLGGLTTGGLMGVMWGTSDGLSGIGREIFQRLLEIDGAQEGSVVPFDTEAMKQVLCELVRDANVQLLLYVMVVDVIRESNLIRGVIIEGKAGREALLSKVIIEATGDGDVAAFAGVPFHKGRKDSKMRPVTLIFRVGNIDLEKLIEYAKSHPDQFMADTHVNIIDPANQFLRLAGFYDLVKQSCERGELPPHIHYLRVENVWFKKKMALINTTRTYDIDGTDPWELSKAQMDLMSQINKIETFIKKNVPGFSNAFIIDTASLIGVRETRHILGKYLLQEEEILKDKFFEDAIYHNTTYLPLGKEMHTPDGIEGSEADKANRIEKWTRHSHSVPFGCLVARDLRNFLIAGRCISATHEADRWTRHIPVCYGTGQAVGTAAALSVKSNTPVDELPINKIQESLTKQKVRIR